MKLFVALSALIAIASASHLYYAPGLTIPAAAISSQHHSQDGIGQYSYGYNDHLSTKQEVKSLDGVTRGSYSYIDSNNVLQTVVYTADDGGFRVAATNLPKAVQAPIIPAQNLPKQVDDTEEVAIAKVAHFAAIAEANRQSSNSNAASSILTSIELPKQVADTPEVAAAKTAHLAAVEKAKKQIGSSIEPPQQVLDTPEVAKAKAEHLIAIEQAKLRNSYVIQNAPVHLLSLPLSRGFSYSSGVVHASVLSNTPYLRSQVVF